MRERRCVRRLGVGLVAGLALMIAASPSQASLTPSEEVLVRQFTGGAQLGNVQKVRSLIARPDLSDAESAAAMTAAVAVPMTEARVAFLRELVFGTGSQASRNVLARAVTRGLVARADSIFEHSPNLDTASDASAELLSIYGFLGGDIANAGHPTLRTHDATAGIDNTTYEVCAKALADHLKRHAARLQPGTPLSAVGTRVRAQAMLATFDMGGDSPTRIIDGADRLGLDGVRRALLIERGVLLVDSGKSPAALGAMHDLLRRLRSSTIDHVEAIYFGDDHPNLRARGVVLASKAPIDSTDRTSAFPDDEVEASPIAAPLADLAGPLSLEASRRALASRGDLRVVVQRDAQAQVASGDARRFLGAPIDGSPEAAAAGALRLLLVDAPRTLDLVMARFIAGRPESAALVSDALGVLAASAGPDGVQSLVVGKANADGTSAPLPVSAVRLLPSGAVASFTLGSAHWEITRGDTGIVTGVRQNGQPLAFGMLASAHIPVAGGQSWSSGGVSLTALQGSPLVGIVAGPRVRIVGQGDLDMAMLAAPGPDVAFDADVRASGSFAILLRAHGGKGDFGIGLRVVPGSPTKIAIVTIDDKGADHSLAESSALPSVEHVHVEVRGGTIRASCTHRGQPPRTAALEAQIPQQLTHGDVAFAVKRGVWLEVASPVVRRN